MTVYSTGTSTMYLLEKYLHENLLVIIYIYIYIYTVYTCKLQNQCKHASEISIFISLSLNTTNVFLALNSKHTHKVRIESMYWRK